MWIATIIPAENVKRATVPFRDRMTKEERRQGVVPPTSPHRVKGQKVRVSNSRESLLDWIMATATEEDHVTLRRWKRGKGKKKRWRGGTRFG